MHVEEAPWRGEGVIVAPVTPTGRSAVAMIRLSGAGTAEVLCAVFRPTRGANDEWKPWRLRSGLVLDPQNGETIDRALAVWMPGPATYTGEDVAEISCHGSPLIVETILKTLIDSGARLAEPGEFTRRAFLNGRIDLAEAEAVCDVIVSETAASLGAARRQLLGRLSEEIAGIRRDLIEVSAEIEAWIDFPEDEIPAPGRQRLVGSLNDMSERIATLLRGARRGRRLREGARVAIVGRVNIGKSSLLNAIAGSERAISSPHPGTTRDTIEARIDCGGIAVDLVDTAGIRAPENEIEKIGVERSRSEIEKSDLALWLVDRSRLFADEDRQVFRLVRSKPFLLVLTKCDLPPTDSADSIIEFLGDEIDPESPEANTLRNGIETSAKTGAGIDNLESQIAARLIGPDTGAESPGEIVSNVRHIQALEQARTSLGEAASALSHGDGLELVMIDIRGAIDPLGAILGLEIGEEVLDRIFERFCLGK